MPAQSRHGRQCRHVPMLAISDRLVDLVADQHHVPAFTEMSDPLQFRRREHRAHRIPRRIQNQRLHRRSPRPLQRFHRQHEPPVLNLRPHRPNHPARQPDRRLIRVVDRIRQQHLIPFAQQRLQRGIDPKGRAGRGQNLGAGVELEVVIPLQLPRHRLAKTLLAAIIRIPRAPVPQRPRARLHNMRRCGQIRLAAHQRDKLAALRLKLPHFGENGVDRGGLKSCDTIQG